MILPRCRAQLTEKDFSLIAETFSQSKAGELYIVESCKEGSIDNFLEDPKLYQYLIHHPHIIKVSPQLFFYVGTLHALQTFGIQDTELTDYVASILVSFMHHDRFRRIHDHHEAVYDWISDLEQEAAEHEGTLAFLYHTHIGNYSLFLAGMFPEYVSLKNSSRRFPLGLPYYEQKGSKGYFKASQSMVSLEHGLAKIYATLAEEFGTVRKALNMFKNSLREGA